MQYIFKYFIIVLLSILIASCVALPNTTEIIKPILPQITNQNYFQVKTIEEILHNVLKLVIYWIGLTLFVAIIICLITQWLGNTYLKILPKIVISLILCFPILYLIMKFIGKADYIPNFVFCSLVFVTANSGWSWLINDLKLQNHISTFLTDKEISK
jgi:flagellar biosynthesis protein FlhB